MTWELPKRSASFLSKDLKRLVSSVSRVFWVSSVEDGRKVFDVCSLANV